MFFDATSFVKAGKKGLPDGLKIDVDGNLFATGPGGVFVFSPGGQAPRHHRHRRADRQLRVRRRRPTLYMTANDKLMRIRLKTRGVVGK